MAKVWLCVPARRNTEDSTVPEWRASGYKAAIAREPYLPSIECDLLLPIHEYPGWPRCVNTLASMVFLSDPEAEWIVTCGDDTHPDLSTHPHQIAEQLKSHFCGTFGICQPIGDPRKDSLGHIAPRVAGSPWMGREFAMRMYHGGGPLYPGYHHNHADQELKDVAEMLGCYWMRPDLMHRHDHWAYKRGSREDMPAWAAPLHTPEAWRKSNGLYQSRKLFGFPGHEPLEENNGTEDAKAKND